LLSKNNVADPSGRPLPGRLFFLCGGFEINFEDFLRKWWVGLGDGGIFLVSEQQLDTR
jgi:hypothetical protein